MADSTRRLFSGSGRAFLAVTLAVSGQVGCPFGPRLELRGAEIRTSDHHDPDVHLFVDDVEIERMERLERVLNRPKKHPVPVLVADQPWEGERAQAWGSVIVEPDGLLRMWYFAMNTETTARRTRPGRLCLCRKSRRLFLDETQAGRGGISRQQGE
jgi:hypothetical protein